MRELVEFLARSLADQPDAVQVTEETAADGESVILKVRVDPEDMGKVIGRQGRIVKAIQTLARAAAVKTGKRVEVEIVS